MGDRDRRGMQLHFHGALSGLVREGSLFDRPHLVAPVVMVREMVLDQGDHGQLLPAEEIEESAAKWLWEGRPVTIGHPERDGQWLSAGVVDAAEAAEIGSIRNVEADDSKGFTRLVGEAWIDVQKAERLERGQEVLDRLRKFMSAERDAGAAPLEVSTGYWATLEREGGLFGRERYRGVQRNIFPDHLAVLPDDVGKCSLRDGCGMPRLNADGLVLNADGDPIPEAELRGDADAGSLTDAIAAAVRSALTAVFRPATTEGDGDGTVLNVVGPAGQTDGAGWAVRVNADPGAGDDGDGDDDPTTTGDEESLMERNEVIQELLDCDDCPFDEEQLNEMSGETLHAVALARGVDLGKDVTPQSLAKEPAGNDDAGDADDDPAPDATDDGGDPADDATGDAAAANRRAMAEILGVDVDDLDEVGEAVRNVVADRKSERDQLIVRLAKSDRCVMTRDQLGEFSTEALKGLAGSILEDRRYDARRAGGRANAAGGDGNGDSYFDRHPRTPPVVTRNVRKEKRQEKDAD